MTEAYASARFGRSMPPFTTEDFALLPFYVDQQAVREPTKSNITAKTTSLFAKLICTPAAVGKPTFNDARWGTWEIYPVNGSRQNSGYYWVDYFGVDAASGYWLPPLKSKCPPNSSSLAHSAMVISMLQPPRKGGLTVSQVVPRTCERRYYKQEVMATVDAFDFKVYPESLRSISEPSQLLQFDSQSFEQRLLLDGFGMEFGNEDGDNRSASVDEIEELIATYEPAAYTSAWALIATRASRMRLFADTLHGQNLPAEAKVDREALEKALHRAHRYLFSYTVSSTLANQTEHELGNRTAMIDTLAYGILVSPYFATAAESLLLLIAIIASTLLYFCCKAQCYLLWNPNSISRLCCICSASPGIINLYRSLATTNEKIVESLLQDSLFRLSHCGCTYRCQLWLEEVKPSTAMRPGDIGTGQARLSDMVNARAHHYKPAIPFEVTRKAGILLIIILLGILATFATLKWQEVSQAGLRRPSEAPEVLLVLEKALPTAFATLLEAFWSLLNLQLCVLQPFREPCAGTSRIGTSIATTYSAVPPQLTIWRALKARHFLLVALCLTSLGAKALFIGLGGLFNENDTTAWRTQAFEPVLSPSLNISALGSTIREMLRTAQHTERQQSKFSLDTTAQNSEIVLYAHFRYGTRLPAWVSSRYFFQPHRPTGQESASTDVYAFNTRGFGLNANCTPCLLHPLLSQNDRTSLDAIGRCPETTVHATPWTEDGKCVTELESELALDIKCGTAFMIGWDVSPGEQTGLTGAAAINHHAVCCQPVLQTAMFDVTVDSAGFIKSADRTTALEHRIDLPSHNETNMHMMLRAFINYALPHAWVNEYGFYFQCPSELFATLFGGSTGRGRQFLETLHPLPDPVKLIPLVEDFYSKYFAILLWSRQEIFQRGRASDSILGSRLVPERRIFMDQYALGIVTAILLIDIAVAIVFYSSISAIRILPHMPNTIGSLIAYIAPSRLVARWRSRSIDENTAIRFGRYPVGLGSERHIGIEMEQYVLPVDAYCLEKRGTTWRAWLSKLSWPSWRTIRTRPRQPEESGGQPGGQPASLNTV
ncbi:hypothetical protein CDD83_7608 [Cordyceps sp. RAO-2017]|nr:hypothetical protein CDD83_7608 [Cordyceps sp. RAO-2017]